MPSEKQLLRISMPECRYASEDDPIFLQVNQWVRECSIYKYRCIIRIFCRSLQIHEYDKPVIPCSQLVLVLDLGLILCFRYSKWRNILSRGQGSAIKVSSCKPPTKLCSKCAIFIIFNSNTMGYIWLTIGKQSLLKSTLASFNGYP